MADIECARRLSRGAEHIAFRSANRKKVLKIPNRFGEFWHVMKPELAEEDQRTLSEYGMPHVRTKIEIGPHDIYVGGKLAYEDVSYLMSQPFVSGETLNFGHLVNDMGIRRQMLDMLEKGERILDEKKLGVDFIGGSGIAELIRLALLLRLKTKAAATNVVVPDKDQFDDEGEPVAKRGELLLWDTKLYRCDGDVLDIKSQARKRLQLIQNEVFHEFLEHLDDSPESRRVTVSHLIGRVRESILDAIEAGLDADLIGTLKFDPLAIVKSEEALETFIRKRTVDWIYTGVLWNGARVKM